MLTFFISYELDPSSTAISIIMDRKLNIIVTGTPVSLLEFFSEAFSLPLGVTLT
jgi:hypothetical protein